MDIEDRIYALKASERWLGFILAPLLTMVWLVVGMALLLGTHDLLDIASGVALIVVPCGLFTWGFLYSLRTKVTFTGGEIVVQRALRESRVSRSRVAGFRRVRDGHSDEIHLHAAEAIEPLIKLPPHVTFDLVFEAWLATLTDLDARDTQRSRDEFLNDDPTPGSPAEKLASLETSRFLAKGLNWAGASLLALAYFAPSHPLMILAATLLVATAVTLAALQPARFSLGEVRTDVRASLLGACLCSSFALAVSGLRRGVPLDENELLAWSVMATLGGAGAVLAFVPAVRRSRREVLGTLILAAFFGYGVVSAANRDFDRGPMTIHVATIEQRLEEDADERRVRLSAWGPATAGEVSLPAELYEKVTVGNAICVELSPGAFGVRWYEHAECPAG
jgi:hypothetical protein